MASVGSKVWLNKLNGEDPSQNSRVADLTAILVGPTSATVTVSIPANVLEFEFMVQAPATPAPSQTITMTFPAGFDVVQYKKELRTLLTAVETGAGCVWDMSEGASANILVLRRITAISDPTAGAAVNITADARVSIRMEPVSYRLFNKA